MKQWALDEISVILREKNVTSDIGSYQPLGFYERLGYDVDRIKANAPMKQCPVLGDTYLVRIKSVGQSTTEEQIRQQRLSRSSEDPTSSTSAAPSADMGSDASRKRNKEEMTAAKEAQSKFKKAKSSAAIAFNKLGACTIQLGAQLASPQARGYSNYQSAIEVEGALLRLKKTLEINLSANTPDGIVDIDPKEVQSLCNACKEHLTTMSVELASK